MPRNGDTPPRPKVDAGRLWPGGVTTAIVAALAALVGILLCRWLFNIPLLSDYPTRGEYPGRPS
jgi:hypothetical protein